MGIENCEPKYEEYSQLYLEILKPFNPLGKSVQENIHLRWKQKFHAIQYFIAFTDY